MRPVKPIHLRTASAKICRPGPVTRLDSAAARLKLPRCSKCSVVHQLYRLDELHYLPENIDTGLSSGNSE
jgi:hypothetical protein